MATIHDRNKSGRPGFSMAGMGPNAYAHGREKEGIALRIKRVETSLLPLRCCFDDLDGASRDATAMGPRVHL
jgi:hypothetical protein